MTGSMKLGRLVVWALIVMAVVYLTVAGGGGFFGLYVGAFRVLSVGVAVVAIGVWLIWSTRHEQWRPRTALWPAIVACLAALVVSTLASAEPRFAYDYLAYSALLAGLYLLMQRLMADPFFRDRLSALGVLLGFGLSTLYIGAVFLHWVDFWRDLGRFSIPPLRPDFEGLAYGNPSTVATVCILLFLVTVAHVGLASRRQVAVVFSLGVLTALVVFLTGSRGAWVGGALAAGVLIPCWMSSRANRMVARRLLARAGVRRALSLGSLGLIGLTLAFLPAVVSRILEPASDTRLSFYEASIRMFLHKPITGLGPGTWVVERIHYTAAPASDYYIPHAHNIWLQTLSELGLVGMMGGGVMAVAIGAMLLRAWRSDEPPRQLHAWAALTALVYLGAHQLFDFYPNMPAIGFCLALLIARLDALDTNGRQPPSARLFTAIAAIIAVSVVAGATWVARSERAAELEVRAALAGDAGDWQHALSFSTDAVATDPGIPAYRFTAGLSAAHVGDIQAARDFMLESARADDFPTSWLNVARLDTDLGDVNGARASLMRAMRLGYQQPQIAFNVSSILAELGDHEGAITALAAAFEAAPGFVSDPYWQNPLRADVYDAAVTIALNSLPPSTGYQLALEAGRLDIARALASKVEGRFGHVAVLEVEAWSGNQSAFDELHALARADPLQDKVVARCRRIAARSQEADWAGPIRWDCDGAGFPASLFIVRVSTSPATRVVLPGPNSSWHIQYVYRRAGPIDELVPGLVHLAVVFL